MPYYFEGALQEKRQVYLSQNGVEWVDLPSLPADKAKFAARLTGWLTGDLAFISTVTEEPPPPPPVAEGEEPAAPAEPLVIEVTEQQRVAYIVDTISAATRITPKGYLVVNAANELARNKAYAGLSFPARACPTAPRCPPRTAVLRPPLAPPLASAGTHSLLVCACGLRPAGEAGLVHALRRRAAHRRPRWCEPPPVQPQQAGCRGRCRGGCVTLTPGVPPGGRRRVVGAQVQQLRPDSACAASGVARLRLLLLQLDQERR